MRVTPHLVAELRARQHPLGVSGQDREEVELGHRQRDLVFADLHPPSGVVDLQRADAHLDDVVSLEAADLGHEHPHGHVVLDDEDATPAARWWAAQLGFGGAKPTRRDSRAERFGLRIRITRLSPPSTTLASSHPSAAASWSVLTSVVPSATWATLRTRVENSHSRLGSPTAGISPAAAPRAPSGWAGAGSSGSSSGPSSNLGSIGSIVVDSRLCLNN